MADNEALQNWSRSIFLAQLELADDNLEAAKEHYIDALNASILLRNSNPLPYAQTQVALSSVCLLADDAEGAICFLLDVLPIYEKYYPRSHYKMLELYHLIANAHHGYGLLTEAKHWYELTLENMGHYYFDNADKKVVVDNYAKLLKVYRRAA
jgi:hypothetical protein